MFNIKILKLKDLIKSCLILILVLSILFLIIHNTKNNDNQTKNDGIFNYDLTCCIDSTSSIIKNTNKPEQYNIKAYKSDLYEDILKSQIGAVEDFREVDDTYLNKENKTPENSKLESENNNGNNNENISDEKIENQENKIKEEKKENIELAKTGLQTEIITKNPLPLSYNTQYGNVKIKNETSHELTPEILNPNIKIENKNILLFHTHTCESYTSSSQFEYEPTGNFRTTDLNFTVARVGDELESHLKKYGYNVLHNKDYHDYPSYNGSYTNSLNTVTQLLKKQPTDIIFDIHRDAIGSRSDYAPTVKIGDDEVAQIMFVIGSDEGGLWHPNWNSNLKFAVKVQEKAEQLYPGLFKPIILTKYRYNQHSGKYAGIIEVGATGNTLEQCLNSMKYLAKILDEVMKE